MRVVPDGRSGGVALESRLGQAYNEEAFRYFLEIERKRAARFGRTFQLLLVDLKNQGGAGVLIDPVLAAKIFSALWLCLRETDIVGWYREELVVGAVLTQLTDEPHPEAPRIIRARVVEELRNDLPAAMVGRLRLRLNQIRPPRRINGALHENSSITGT